MKEASERYDLKTLKELYSEPPKIPPELDSLFQIIASRMYNEYGLPLHELKKRKIRRMFIEVAKDLEIKNPDNHWVEFKKYLSKYKKWWKRNYNIGIEKSLVRWTKIYAVITLFICLAAICYTYYTIKTVRILDAQYKAEYEAKILIEKIEGNVIYVKNIGITPAQNVTLKDQIMYKGEIDVSGEFFTMPIVDPNIPIRYAFPYKLEKAITPGDIKIRLMLSYEGFEKGKIIEIPDRFFGYFPGAEKEYQWYAMPPSQWYEDLEK